MNKPTCRSLSVMCAKFACSSLIHYVGHASTWCERTLVRQTELLVCSTPTSV